MAPHHDPAPVQPAPSVTAFVGHTGRGPLGAPVRVAGLQDYLATFGPGAGTATALDHAVSLFFANGGDEAVVVRAMGPTPEQIVPLDGVGGLRALTGPFTVLVLPGVTAAHPVAVAHAMDRCAEERAVLLLDLPSGASATSAVLATDQVTGPRSRVAAYHPWVLVPTDGEPVAVPPSGAVAGLLARTDAAEGVWGSPAGLDAELVGVAGPTTSLTEEDTEQLGRGGVNALRVFPGGGPRVWGVRTLGARDSAEPAERYLPVRRLTDHVLTSLEEGMAFVAGRRAEPGLGDLVRRLAEGFLDGLWRQGALEGDRPAEAYFARCDSTTTTRADLDAGRIVLLVGIATTRPAEFEVHRLDLDTSTATGPDVLPPWAALAAANRLATDHLTVVRRVDLRPLVSADPAETRRRLAHEFEVAAHNRTVLLLQKADALRGRRPSHVGRLLDQLSRDSGVPYVLAGSR